MKKYVLAIDIGKGASKIGLYGLNTENMRTIKIMKPRNFKHSIEGLDGIGKALAGIPMDQVGVMMESTYVYQMPVVEYFKRKGFDEITVVNPLKIKRTCGDIQKVKTDMVDCDRISAYYFFSQWEKPLTVSKEQREARELSRYIDFLQKEATRVGNKIRQNLSNVFPELERIGDSKGSLFKAGFLNLIEKTPHPLSIRKKTKAGIISTMAGKGRHGWKRQTRFKLRRVCVPHHRSRKGKSFLGPGRRDRSKPDTARSCEKAKGTLKTNRRCRGQARVND